MIGVGATCALLDLGYGILMINGIVGVLMMILGALQFTQTKQAFNIVLKTAGGEVTAYQSFDREHISRIIRALNDSIISHG